MCRPEFYFLDEGFCLLLLDNIFEEMNNRYLKTELPLYLAIVGAEVDVSAEIDPMVAYIGG